MPGLYHACHASARLALRFRFRPSFPCGRTLAVNGFGLSQ
jgi:hypothetical protein